MNVLIIGSGGHCRSVLSLIKNSTFDIKVSGIIDINFNGLEETIMDIPVIGGMNELFNSKANDLILAIGDNNKRKEIVESLKNRDYNFPNIFHKQSFVDKEFNIGVGNIVSCFCFVGPKVSIGNFNIINNNSVMEHEVIIGNYNHLAPSSTVCGRSQLGDNIFLGANSVVIENIKVPDSVVLGAGSTLIKNPIKKGLRLGGSPAKKL